MRLEITCPLNLEPERAALLDRHSFLNIFNVLEKQLALLSDDLHEPGFREFMEFCVDFLVDMGEKNFQDSIPVLQNHFGNVSALAKKYLQVRPDKELAIVGLLDILETASVCVNELREDRFAWKWTSIDQIKEKLVQFLTATEKFSGGRFHFIYNNHAAPKDGYLIQLEIRAPGGLILAPPVLEDNLRDLVGNARKYSKMGSRIEVFLEQDTGKRLVLKIRDEGMGIPAGEIEKVVQYGYRASNALDRRTMGGGFGLTKAYSLCRRFNGRFFIESIIGKGTTVELHLPLPSTIPEITGEES